MLHNRAHTSTLYGCRLYVATPVGEFAQLLLMYIKLRDWNFALMLQDTSCHSFFEQMLCKCTQVAL